MSIQIKEVFSKGEMKAFINFPYDLYEGNDCFVPPLRFDEAATLDRKKNPAFDYCEARYWLAYKDNKVVGRIAGIINNAYIDKWKNKYVRFGWIDFIDDYDVSRLLIEQVEDYRTILPKLNKRGIEKWKNLANQLHLPYEVVVMAVKAKIGKNIDLEQDF